MPPPESSDQCVDPESPLPLALRGSWAAPCLSPWAELLSSSSGFSVVSLVHGVPEPVAPIQSRPRRPSVLPLDTPCGLSTRTLCSAHSDLLCTSDPHLLWAVLAETISGLPFPALWASVGGRGTGPSEKHVRLLDRDTTSARLF